MISYPHTSTIVEDGWWYRYLPSPFGIGRLVLVFHLVGRIWRGRELPGRPSLGFRMSLGLGRRRGQAVLSGLLLLPL